MRQHRAYYIDSENNYSFVGYVADAAEASKMLKEILTKKNFKCYYTRMWIAENKKYGFLLKYDFGSWSEFFAVQFESHEEAHRFLLE